MLDRSALVQFHTPYAELQTLDPPEYVSKEPETDQRTIISRTLGRFR